MATNIETVRTVRIDLPVTLAEVPAVVGIAPWATPAHEAWVYLFVHREEDPRSWTSRAVDALAAVPLQIDWKEEDDKCVGTASLDSESRRRIMAVLDAASEPELSRNKSLRRAVALPEEARAKIEMKLFRAKGKPVVDERLVF